MAAKGRKSVKARIYETRLDILIILGLYRVLSLLRWFSQVTEQDGGEIWKLHFDFPVRHVSIHLDLGNRLPQTP